MGSVESVVEAVQYKTVQDITVQCSAVQERKERAEQRGYCTKSSHRTTPLNITSRRTTLPAHEVM
jgi:hypothetical protein